MSSSLASFPEAFVSPQRILVTGAAGFIGSHTTDLLLAQGHEVLGLDDFSTGSRTNVHHLLSQHGYRLVEGDMLEPGRLESLVSGFRPHAIIHLAGLVSVALAEEEPHRNFRLNVESTQLVAETARLHGVKRVVFASSAAVYGDLEALPLREDASLEPKGNYGTAKLISEMLLTNYARTGDMTCVSARFFNVFGPRQDPHSPYSGVISIFAERYSQGRQVTIFGDGTASRDFISVYDIAQGVVLAATRPGVPSGAYNLCNGTRQSLLRLVEILEWHFPEAPAVAFGEERAGDIKHSQGDNAKARKLLGFNARVDFSAGIHGLLDFLAEKPAAA